MPIRLSNPSGELWVEDATAATCSACWLNIAVCDGLAAPGAEMRIGRDEVLALIGFLEGWLEGRGDQ